MLSKYISSAAVLALAQLAAAQTHTDCNPMEKTCKNDPALGTTIDADFTQGQSPYFYEFAGTTINYTKDGALFTIKKETDAPTVGSHKYIFFGKIDVTIRAAPGNGVVTSFVLQSDNLDEIDWEWLGGDVKQVQTNYFGKGDTTTYDRGAYHPVANPQLEDHTYTIDWTKDYVKWYIDGALVRTLLYKDAQGGTRFPQTPMQIKLGSWVAGRKDAPEGTVQWAGGYTDFSQGPFVAYYKDIKITDYSNGVKGAKEYVWAPAPNNGAYTDITVSTSGGSGSAEEGGSVAASSTASSAAATKTSTLITSTKSASATKTSSSATATGTSSDQPTTTGNANAIVSATPSGAATPSTSPVPGAAFKNSFSPIALGAALVAAIVF
ncbi:concanavalin A-like lectin/glucanase domain-containing protein [Microdochium trichocladiopsis]|uniref:Crh-like protein n=1 Tax=Microdochium trichocladiopsis TaxID=1682393 RepID=A0A9P9BKU9_9PEZI|nr:concanavalin A-like lectin/glucanase domain-containing protein [Microdochium trichocladiopsis]KAH7020982.1 concanavalin A-like lectin/glucanase domain-containing protein [Microdochium trichocladiopsis]